MRNTRYVYECKCGQLTAVDVAAERPLCSRCGEQTFTYASCFDSNASHAASNWIKSGLRVEYMPDGPFELQAESSSTPIDDLIDRKSGFGLSRARALLDHLDMLLSSKVIGDEVFEEEKRRVLQRVVNIVGNSMSVKGQRNEE